MSSSLILAPLAGLALIAAAAYAYFVYAPLPAEPRLSAQAQAGAIEVGARTRSYLAYVPAGLPAGAPLLLVLHGSSLDGAKMRGWTGYEFDQQADQHGFAVVYPDGYQGNWNDCRTEVTFPARQENIDDMGFLRALIKRMQQQHGIDPARVYLFGLSNGGQMAFRVALEAPDLVAGIAVAGSNLFTAATLACPLTGPTPPVLLIAGMADPISPYAGGRVTIFGFGYRGQAQSAQATAETFARLNGLPDGPTSTTLPHQRPGDPTSVERQDWKRAGQAYISLYSVRGGGHVVPQPVYRAPRIMGRTTADLDAPVQAVQFFKLATGSGPAASPSR